MENIGENKPERFKILLRMAITALIVLLVFIYFNFANAFSLIVLLAIFLGIILFRNYLWIIFIFAIPFLAFSQFVNLPIATGWGYEATLTEVLLIFITLVFLLDKFLKREIGEIKADAILILLSAYLGLSLFSYFYIADFRYYIFGLKLVAFGVLSYFLALNLINEKKKINLFLYSLSITAFILAGEILYKFYEMGFSTKFFFGRHNILLPLGPLATASAILAFLTPLVLVHYFNTPNTIKTKPFLFIIFILSGLAVFLSLGKAAIFSLFLGFLYLFIKLKDKRKKFGYAFLVLAAISIVVFSSFLGGLAERIKTTFVDQNSKYRVLEYQVGWEIIKDNLWLGAGTGQQLYYFKKILNFDKAQLVNNYFLQAFIDLGLAGLALALFLAMSIFVKVIGLAKELFSKNNYLVTGFIAALIVAFVNGLAEVTIFALPYAVIFWSALGVFGNLSFITPPYEGGD